MCVCCHVGDFRDRPQAYATARTAASLPCYTRVSDFTLRITEL